MKKYITLPLILFMLTACNSNASQPQSPATQQAPNIVENNTSTDSNQTNSNNITSNIEEMNDTTTVNATADTSATVTTEIIENYYKIVAEEKAIEADIEKLEKDFTAKRIDANTLQTQKATLKQQENTLENQIDALEYQIPISLPQNWVDTSNMEQMIQKLKEVEIAENQLELSIDQAEQDYINNTITREDFITKVIELEKQKDILDKQDDFLEQTLESLGWDD